MDRPLEEEYRKRELIKKGIGGIAVLTLILALFFLIPGWIKSSVSRGRIRTAVVDRGNVEATVTCTGIVEPEFEKVITRPIETKIEKVLKSPGTFLADSERILILDLKKIYMEIENLTEQVNLKIQQQEKLKLDAEKTAANLESRIKIKELTFEVLRSKKIQQENLLKIGGTSREAVKQAELSANVEEIELGELRKSLKLEKKVFNNQFSTLETEILLLRQKLNEQRLLAHRAEVRSEGTGVLTWVKDRQGSSVAKGQVVARIADFSSFKVKATISDIHAAKISTGQEVIVKVNDLQLPGRVSIIFPTIENGIVTFYVSLDDKTNDALRSNLRTGVYLVTEKRIDVLRVTNGPFAAGSGMQEVFIIEGGRAVRKKVTLGISNFDYYEIIEGLAEGDEVIISDMKDYLHMETVTIKN